MNIATQVAVHAALRAGEVESKLLSRLRDVGALSPRAATPIALEACDEEDALHRLLARGIVVEGMPGRFYADEEALAVRKQTRQRHFQRAIACALVLAAGLMFLRFVLG